MSETFDKIAAYVEEHHGAIGAHFMGATGWHVQVVFGREDPDSPIVGGAAHGVADTIEEALIQAAQEIRL